MKILKKELEDKLRILLDSIWDCPRPFNKEQLVSELDKNGIVVKDFDAIKTICKDFLFEEDGLYTIDITNVFNKQYKIKEER